ncbi:sulfotransferase domain-containing protein [Synechococcus sp. HK05]|uniref:sulfotransferase domain-containing protein n=1 Tax=Synechococcus sp. HK05 TaxID=2725975 RepID=UPI001C388CE5|nr:sulfotransferase domain-containing protein [Synechococcus sp. HK05]MBV2352137.1 sulfotransferase domain-containing protein [Synechococcus sp. HK05]
MPARSGEPRVGFLIAGVQKGGTTALADYLRQHPGLFIPAAKELHFFDNETLNWQQPQQLLPLYHAHFREAPAGSLCGEATPIYSYWWPAMARIWTYNPAMRLILCLRNPVERAYSHWAMETARHWDSLSFAEALASEPERCRAALPEQHRVFSYASRGFYSEQLRRLWSFFPKQQTLIVCQEQLLADPATILGAVHRFLGVEPLPPAQPLRANSGRYGKAMEARLRDQLQQLFHAEITQLEQMLGWDLSHWRSPSAPVETMTPQT